ncbi:hypothetical protein EV182_005105, partial [Spiromyces aspiralis]
MPVGVQRSDEIVEKKETNDQEEDEKGKGSNDEDQKADRESLAISRRGSVLKR